ncbi:hypothetical protein JG687_00018672, partial [Phytophthora cactorum]
MEFVSVATASERMTQKIPFGGWVVGTRTSATSTDTVIFEDTAEREVAEDVGESPTMPSPAY